MNDLVSALRAAGCVFAEDEAAQLVEAAAGDTSRLGELTRRRIAGEPLEHLVGWVDFDGRRMTLTPGVFIPRQRSVWLVELAVSHLAGDAVAGRDAEPGVGRAPARLVDIRSGTRPIRLGLDDPTHPQVVLDLGCGAGALGAAIGWRRTGAGWALRVHATDRDPRAVACTDTNLAAVPGLLATSSTGDLFAPVPAELTGKVDVIVANLPYVPRAARALMPAESRDHEPPATTDGGPDGLDLVRRAATEAARWLRPGGMLLVETGDASTGQDALAAHVFREAGLLPRIHHDAERGATAVAGTR